MGTVGWPMEWVILNIRYFGKTTSIQLFAFLQFYLLAESGTYTYRVAQKKNVPNFAQVFSRSLSRYEGDIFQVYWASNLEYVWWIWSLSVNISWRY